MLFLAHSEVVFDYPFKTELYVMSQEGFFIEMFKQLLTENEKEVEMPRPNLTGSTLPPEQLPGDGWLFIAQAAASLCNEPDPLGTLPVSLK